MGLRCTSVSSAEVFQTRRFEPRYFLNRNMLSSAYKKYGEKTIHDVATLRSGSTPVHSDVRTSDSDAYFIKSASVKRYNINKTTICYVTEKMHKSREKMAVFPGDVLVTNTGKYLGFASVIPQNIPVATTNQNISCVRVKKESPFDAFFLAAYLNSYFGQQEIESLLTRTGQKYLNSDNFRKLRIPLIDNKKIQIISDLMKAMTEKETQAVQLIEEAQALLYSVIGVDIKEIKAEKFYSTNLSSFKSEGLWTPSYTNPLYLKTIEALKRKSEIIPLGKLVSFDSGDEVGSDSYIEYIDVSEHDVPFIRTTDIINYDLDLYPDFFVKPSVYSDMGQDIKEGDIVFSKDGKLGMVGMITKSDKAILGSGFAILRLTEDAEKLGVTPEYLFLVLSIREIGIYGAVRRAVVASTITHLRDDRLAKLEVPIVEQKTREAITEKVKKAFSLKAERKDLLREIRQKIDSYLNE